MAITKLRVVDEEATNSEGVEADFHFPGDSTLTELAKMIFSQDGRGCANLRQYDRNPVEVAADDRASFNRP